ncbi:MAG: RNA-binding S4 domain-containing protein [Planctomycetales bacterium]|nr:RNA-binding S4 domain-containing protein [Planctomycetales bacterium]MCA9171287.1 RNA-binding S4 domain-containing protein [Planctomycetales bacterium]
MEHSNEDQQPTTPTIHLDQFLKLMGLMRTGGQAKVVIQAGEVMVNGEVETRRRRQLRDGDCVSWNGEEIVVEFNGE